MKRLSIPALIGVALALLFAGLGATPPAWAASNPVPIYFQKDPCPGASLCGNFLTGRFKGSGKITPQFAALPNLTVTRASFAYGENADGSLKPFQAGQARLTSKGLGRFEATTNLLIWSQDATSGSWTRTDYTVTAAAKVALDGTLTGQLATAGSAGTDALTSPNATVVASSTETGHWYVAQGNTRWARIVYGDSTGTDGFNQWVDLSACAAGSHTLRGAGTWTAAHVTAAPNGWCNIDFTGVASTRTTVTVTLVSATADASLTRVSGATYYTWGLDLRAGAYPVPYCPTTSSTATCAADNVAITGLNLPVPFSITARAIPTNTGVASTLLTVGDAGGANQIKLVRETNNQGYAYGVSGASTVATFSTPNGVFPGGSTMAGALSCAGGSYNASYAGVPFSAVSAACPAAAATRLDLGGISGGGAFELNGYLQSFAVTPVALTAAQAQAASVPLDTSSLSLNFASGLYKTTTPYVRTNYVLNSEAPATQTVTLPVGSYTLAVTGSGSATTAAGTATLSGAGSATAGSPNTITVTVAGTVTVTVSGSLTRFQLQNGHYPSSYVPTTTLVASTATYQSVNPADIGDLSYTGPAGYAPDCNGNLVSFAANVPRITCAGVLIEEARTNLALWSQDFSNAAWSTFGGATKVGMAPVTDPAGGNTAYEIAFGPTGGTIANASAVYQTGTVNSGVAYTHTLYVRAKTGTTTVRIYQDNGVGAQGTSDTTVTSTAWTRIPLTVTGAANAAATWGIRNNVAGNSGNVYVAFDMREAGAFATSFIATTSATVTRPADVMSYGGLSLAAPSTVGASFNVPALPAATGTATIVGGSAGFPELALGNGTASNVVALSARTLTGLGNTTATYTAGTQGCTAARYQSGGSGVSLGGSASVTNATTFTPSATGTLFMGYDGVASTAWLNGALQNVRVYAYGANDNGELPYRSACGW